MRISDWSSDVCSSDLGLAFLLGSLLRGPSLSPDNAGLMPRVRITNEFETDESPARSSGRGLVRSAQSPLRRLGRDQMRLKLSPSSSSKGLARSEERRVGNEGVSPGRSRGSPDP